MKQPIRRPKPEKTGINAPLGDLEQAVMRYVWDSLESGVLGGEIQRRIDQIRPIALTTVLTTLERLRIKGIVRREREGKAYRYWAAVSEEELQQRIVGGVLDRLIAQFPHAVATYFSQQASPEGPSDSVALSDLARRMRDIKTAPRMEDDHGR